MKQFVRVLVSLYACAQTVAQSVALIPGSQRDSHDCVLDAGYEWCESAQACQRPWELPCEALQTETCPDSCVSIPCPPLPPQSVHCSVVQAATDSCGCAIACPTFKCQSTVAAQGESCGGYMVPEMARNCGSGLECVSDSRLPDAPGVCMPMCAYDRDQNGRCIEPQTPPVVIAHNCVSWYDGCNTCFVHEGNIQGCSMMMCFTQNEPYCQAFSTAALEIGDLCYRYCEDGSQSFVDMRAQCPQSSQCVAQDTASVSYDACNQNAYTCQSIIGH